MGTQTHGPRRQRSAGRPEFGRLLQPRRPNEPPQPRDWLWLTGLGLFLAVFLLFASHLLLGCEPIFGGGGDTICTRLLPVSLLTEGNLDLDEFPFLHPGPTCPYNLEYVKGHYYSAFPIGGAVLLTPIYALAKLGGMEVFKDETARNLLSACTAAALAALSVLVVFLTYARRGMVRAGVVALVFGLGTSVWPVCAQDVWQHTFGILFVALALYFLERGIDSPACLGWAGLPVGLLFFVRPGNGLIVALIGLYVLRRQPRQLIRFGLLAVPFLAITLVYNLGVLGHLFGGYHDEAAQLQPWRYIARGLPGLLVSPARGLFVYSPWVLLGCLAPWQAADGRGGLRLTFAAMILVQVLAYSSYGCWYGGYCFGPRFLLEVMPACAGLLWEAWPACTASLTRRILLGVILGWSVLANASGYILDWSVWCSYPDIDRCQDRLWDWRDNPLTTAVLGLPARCPHPLASIGDHYQTQGVGLELGRGWMEDNGNGGPYCLGAESEMIFHLHGQKTNQILLSFRAEKDLPRDQEMTAEVHGQVRARAVLSSANATRLVLPLTPEDLTRDEARVILRFTTWQRRSWFDIRPMAAQMTGLQMHFEAPR